MASIASPGSRERTWIELDREALRHNLGVFRALLGSRPFPIWVVKANAYGHGLIPVATEVAATIRRGRGHAARGEWFGVDSLDEAVALRGMGIRLPIIVLGYVPQARLSELVRLDLRYLVSSHDTVRFLARGRATRRIRVHIKIDTGTARQGVLPEGAVDLARAMRRAGLVVEGVATHFANIEDTSRHQFAARQLERFARTISSLTRAGFALPVVHAACSAAVMLYPETLWSAGRIGIGLYGIGPSPLTVSAFRRRHPGRPLRPVMTWRSRVALVKSIPKGSPVGYGLTERVRRRTTLAVVPVGYADGYDRGLSSVGEVLIRGTRCKVLGRVCMNMCMVDASGAGGVRQEEVVTLIGTAGKHRITADELAERSGTIPYEILARLNPSIPRFVI